MAVTAAEPKDWMEYAACRDTDAEMFFPVGTTGVSLEQINRAISICTVCAAADECLNFALHTNQEFGVWGGYAEDDRRRLRKRWLAERRRKATDKATSAA
ncbi:MAG: WhiB family transcriptional regulator [Acidimicrobiia bacterium]